MTIEREPAAATATGDRGGDGPRDDDGIDGSTGDSIEGATDDVVVGDRPGAGRSRAARQAVEWGLLVVVAIVIALVVKTFLYQAFWIPSGSMLPTLATEDRVLVNKLSYRLHDVERGDLVVFRAPPGEETGGIADLVKRVVGLPGERIEARDGRIYVDERLLDEPYLDANTVTDAFDPVEVPAGAYFVMGDNRGFSKDSRRFGAIPEDDIVGRAFVRIWPLDRLGFL